MEIVKLGSIYLDGVIQTPGFDCGDSAEISFGDTVSGQEISWVRLKSGLLIADRCVCTDISWEQLDNQGLVFGTPIQIDGQFYLCRCLKVGAEKGIPNEWDAALDEAGEANNLWHWSNVCFWGQETSGYNASYHAVRGYGSARLWLSNGTTYRTVDVGFRPALEPLSASCSPDTLMGKLTKAYCPGSVTIEGILVDFNDYDVVLRPSSSLPADCPWATKEDCNVIIGRDNIIWLKES